MFHILHAVTVQPSLGRSKGLGISMYSYFGTTKFLRQQGKEDINAKGKAIMLIDF